MSKLNEKDVLIELKILMSHNLELYLRRKMITKQLNDKILKVVHKSKKIKEFHNKIEQIIIKESKNYGELIINKELILKPFID